MTDIEENEPFLHSSAQVSYGGVRKYNIQDPSGADVSVAFSESRSLHHRRPSWPNADTGSLNVISAKYESLDYDICENHLTLEEERSKGYKFIIKKNVARWFIFLLIGVLTALVACAIDIAVEEASSLKYKQLKDYVDFCVTQNCLYVPVLLWVATNVGPVIIGSLLVSYIEPTAAGSGIPQVKCYLNGVKIPRIVRIKTLTVKVIGVITSVVGGLAAGKEGPMIHSGAVIAAGISQGKSTSFNRDFKIFDYFREDHEKRDFVSGGAAAGVAAAFGAPVGGVLFSLEEGASFWNQKLTWRIFFASIISTFTLNVILSTYHLHPGELTYPGLLNFGKFDSILYDFKELPIFMIMGCIGGLSGSLFNYINYKLTVFRMRFIHRRWLKVIEAAFVAAVAAAIGFVMMVLINDCKPLGKDPTKYPVKLYCEEGDYNAVAAIWFQTPEASVRSLFHDPSGSHKAISVGVFFILYFLLSCVTYGLSVSGGLFIPAILTGAAWGRLVGMAMESMLPDTPWVNPGKYALVGAAAQLGGVVRMTISLTVILIEATGSITFGLPLMLTLLTAKWIGDFFNEGIYDIHIQLSQVPIIPWEPPPLSSHISASEVMNHPVITFKTIEDVGYIMDVLDNETYNGFPVVDVPPGNEHARQGTFCGLILRTQLIVLLQNKMFVEMWDEVDKSKFSTKIFRDQYPRYDTIEDVNITEEERQFTVDLRPFMNCSPYTVHHNATLPRIFRLFRALGLRHLTVVDDTNQAVGMVTRKDIAKFRVWKHQGRMGLEKLIVSGDN